MKTIVYTDGSIESTVWADAHVEAGRARYATPAEVANYERHFTSCDAAMEPREYADYLSDLFREQEACE